MSVNKSKQCFKSTRHDGVIGAGQEDCKVARAGDMEHGAWSGGVRTGGVMWCGAAAAAATARCDCGRFNVADDSSGV